MCSVDADTFKQIFRDHWDAFKVRYPTFDTPEHNYHQTVFRMIRVNNGK